MNESSNVRDTAETVKGIVEAVPVYQDVLQPAAQEIGKALQTVAKTVHIALAPVSALIWGYEQFRDFIEHDVVDRLKNVPAERIINPPPNIAGPALEALRYTGYDEVLRKLYANLLATALDAKTVEQAHPSFVQIIQQLTRDDALLLNRIAEGSAETASRPAPIVDVYVAKPAFPDAEISIQMIMTPKILRLSVLGEEAGCSVSEMTPSLLENLKSLGLIEMPRKEYSAEGTYSELELHPRVLEVRKELERSNEWEKVHFEKYYAALTQFGERFVKACTDRDNHNIEENG